MVCAGYGRTHQVSLNKGRSRRLGVVVISALRRLRQEDCEFKTSLGYIMKRCLKKK
jgi:hypothetical protein